jgi:hypothetical protein
MEYNSRLLTPGRLYEILFREIMIDSVSGEFYSMYSDEPILAFYLRFNERGHFEFLVGEEIKVIPATDLVDCQLL